MATSEGSYIICFAIYRWHDYVHGPWYGASLKNEILALGFWKILCLKINFISELENQKKYKNYYIDLFGHDMDSYPFRYLGITYDALP